MTTRYYSLLIAGALSIGACVVLDSQAHAQGKSAQVKQTKYGKGADHPLKGPLSKDDELSKAKVDEDKKTPPIKERPGKDAKETGQNDKKTTEEEEFDTDTKQGKKSGKSGVDRGPKKDKDESAHGKGYNNEAAQLPPPPSGLMAAIDPESAFGVAGSHGEAMDNNYQIFEAKEALSSYDNSLPLNLERLYGSVIGVDNRVRITPTTSYPWRAMCKLRFSQAGGTYIGSGNMVGPKHMLTAGHCVSNGAGTWTSWMEVIPGYDNGYKPFGSAWATYFRTYGAWHYSRDWNHDFALVTLDRNIGSTVGWFGYGYWPSVNGWWSYRGGYPGDRDSGLNLYYHYGYVLYETALKTFYQIDTFGGDSGSGVFSYPGGYGPYIHTVHAYGATTVNGQPMNSGTKIDYSKFNSIQAWRAADGG